MRHHHLSLIVILTSLLSSCASVNPISPLYEALEKGNDVGARKLINKGADVNAACGPANFTPLMLAAMHGKTETAKLLIKKGANVNAADVAGGTPLTHAVNHVEIARLLIESGANVNSMKADRGTPLRDAVMIGKLSTVQLLINKDANVNIVDRSNYTPLMWVARIGSGSSAAITKLLLSKGADVSVLSSDGKTAVEIATEFKHPEIANMIASSKQARATPVQVASIFQAEAPTAVQSSLAPPESIEAPKPIKGNRGKYMSPFTKGGAVAKWAKYVAATKDNGSDLAATAGGVLGQQVMNKALDFVPFGLGSMISRTAGETAGRAASRSEIKAELPTMAVVKATSDISFNTVNDLALFLYAKHSRHGEYPRVLALAERVYPELKQNYTAAIEQASKSKKKKT